MKLSISSPFSALILVLGLSACAEAEPPAPEAAAPSAPSAALPPTPQSAQPPASAQKPVDKSAGPKVTVEVAEPEIDRDAELTVKRLVVAHGVEGREPVEPAETFSAEDDRIYAFVEVGNADRAPSEIFVSFVREGEAERGRIPLRVGASPRWRTWAYTRLADEPGAWQAIVRDARGRELARAAFEVTAEEPTAAAKPVGEPHI